MLKAALGSYLVKSETRAVAVVKDGDLGDDDSTKELFDCVLKVSVPESQNHNVEVDDGPQGLLSRTLATTLQPDDDRKYTASYDQIIHATGAWKVALSVSATNPTDGAECFDCGSDPCKCASSQGGGLSTSNEAKSSAYTVSYSQELGIWQLSRSNKQKFADDSKTEEKNAKVLDLSAADESQELAIRDTTSTPGNGPTDTVETSAAQEVDRSNTEIDPEKGVLVPEGSSQSLEASNSSIEPNESLNSEDDEKSRKFSDSTPDKITKEQRGAKDINQEGMENPHIESVPGDLANEVQGSSTSDLKPWDQRLGELRKIGNFLSEGTGSSMNSFTDEQRFRMLQEAATALNPDKTNAQRNDLASPVSVYDKKSVDNDSELWKDGIYTPAAWPLTLNEVDKHGTERQCWLMRLQKCAGSSDVRDKPGTVDSQDETEEEDEEKVVEKIAGTADSGRGNAEKGTCSRDHTAEHSGSTKEHGQDNIDPSSASGGSASTETALVSTDAAPDSVVHKRFEWVALREGNLNGSTRASTGLLELPTQAEPKATAHRVMAKHSGGYDVGFKGFISQDAKDGGIADDAKAESKGQSDHSRGAHSSSSKSITNQQTPERLSWPTGGLVLPNPDGCDADESSSQITGSRWPWGHARSTLTAQPRRQSNYSRSHK